MVIFLISGLTTGDFGWGSKTFAKMGRKKINLVALFLKLDVQVREPAYCGEDSDWVKP
jgi:hypothetical protein